MIVILIPIARHKYRSSDISLVRPWMMSCGCTFIVTWIQMKLFALRLMLVSKRRHASKRFCQAHVGLVSFCVQYSLKLFKLNVFDIQYFTEFYDVIRNSNSMWKISEEFEEWCEMVSIWRRRKSDVVIKYCQRWSYYWFWCNRIVYLWLWLQKLSSVLFVWLPKSL